MSRIDLADLRNALDALYSVASGSGEDPFPLEALSAMGSLIGAHTVGYCETPMPAGHGGYELVSRPLAAPSSLHDTLERWGRQDPTHAVYQRCSIEPIAISDVLSWHDFRRLEIYTQLCRELGTADSLRVYLPSRADEAWFFFFDRDRRGFGARERMLVQALRPYLTLWRRRWGDARPAAATVRLTGREREILDHVAAGRSNAEIARELWLSPHTVRKHLENVYRKLGVNNRTEAAGMS
jgi:DNA-binding CsgD family transcriptional regulator